MYNMLFGENEESDVLLKMLNLKRGDFCRYRDVFLTNEGKTITVYTRLGGGNRDYYDEVFVNMEKHPCYVRDYDDDFDCTYCYFVFNVPEEYRNETVKMFKGEPLNVHEKFKELIDGMKENPELLEK